MNLNKYNLWRLSQQIPLGFYCEMDLLKLIFLCSEGEKYFERPILLINTIQQRQTQTSIQQLVPITASLIHILYTFIP